MKSLKISQNIHKYIHKCLWMLISRRREVDFHIFMFFVLVCFNMMILSWTAFQTQLLHNFYVGFRLFCRNAAAFCSRLHLAFDINYSSVWCVFYTESRHIRVLQLVAGYIDCWSSPPVDMMIKWQSFSTSFKRSKQVWTLSLSLSYKDMLLCYIV